MRMNLDVFSMCPSVEAAGRRFASLHRVLRGEFPSWASRKMRTIGPSDASQIRTIRDVEPVPIVQPSGLKATQGVPIELTLNYTDRVIAAGVGLRRIDGTNSQ
jgi:hypothetical protein